MDKEGNDIRNGIYLPEGEWVDYFSGHIYKGGRIINEYDAPFWKLLDFCGRCIYRSDEGHRLLVGDGDIWHHEEEGWGNTILI